ncbi:MAG: hypothetical protein ABJ275_03630 [Maricaulaceae bacterium]
MSKFRSSIIAAGIALAATATIPSYAQSADKRSANAPNIQITNKNQCEFEGGSMVTVKGSDYCLVPVRPKAYHSEIYDGNQLGVIDCPGDKLNDDLYCLFPVTIRKQPAPETASETAEDSAKDE